MGLTVANGAITGTPTETAGEYNNADQDTDSSDPQNQAFGRLSLTLRNAAITLAPAVLPSGIVNGLYTSGVTASGGTGGPYIYSWSGNTPPLSLNASSGAITGTPNATGTFNFTINVSDGSPFTPTFAGQNYSITIFPAISIAPASIPSGDALSAYSQGFTASGGSGTGYSYSIAGLPAGMGFSTVTGLLSGIPTSVGANRFTITATDSLGFTGSQGYTLQVNGALTLAPATLGAGQVGTVYSQAFTASGGSGTGYTYSFNGTSGAGIEFQRRDVRRVLRQPAELTVSRLRQETVWAGPSPITTRSRSTIRRSRWHPLRCRGESSTGLTRRRLSLPAGMADRTLTRLQDRRRA